MKSEAKAKLPATPPETTEINTHCKISLVFTISYHVHNREQLFVWNRGCWHRLRHSRKLTAIVARSNTLRHWSMHPVHILYVTSLNLHFGLMCTFICILENFKLFPRLRFTLSCFPSSETHQHFMCKWRKASSFAEHPPFSPHYTENRLWCKLKIKINSFFDVCLWRLKLYHLSILFYSFG